MTKIKSFKISPFDKQIENSDFICSFCGKFERHSKFCKKLSPDIPYCNFCLRNNYNIKKNNIFILGFNSIIYNNYKYYPDKITLSEILDVIDHHTSIGLTNPIFNYDPDTFFWFIDFNKIDTEKFLSNDILPLIKDMVKILFYKIKLSNKKMKEIKVDYFTGLKNFYKTSIFEKPYIVSINEEDYLKERTFYFENLLIK